MRTILTTFLDCPKERVWQEVQTVRLLAYIAAPIVGFEPLQPTCFPDHRIIIHDEPNGKTRYSDDVEIEAGLLTPFVWLFSQAFYRHRQRQWQKLVAKNFQY